MKYFINHPILNSTCFVSLKHAFFACILVLSTSTFVFGASANLSWNANTEPDLAGYKVYIGTASGSYGSPTPVGIVTSYTASGLSDGTYFFAVTAVDTSGNESGFSNEVSKTLLTPADTTPPSILNITAGNLSTTGASISWVTDESADAQVEYGTTSAYGSTSPLNPSLGTSHTIDLTSLTTNTTYHFRVLSRDAAGNLASSTDLSFVTLDATDSTSPLLSGITVSGLTPTGAIITWSTDEGASSQVDYGTTSAYGSATTKSTGLVNSHSQTLSGLSPATSYHFRVRSSDANGNEAISGGGTFTTPASSGLMITNLNVLSGLPYKIVNSGLKNNALIYIDRSYTFSGIPTALDAATYIQPANNDKNATDNAFLSFDINENANIYVAHDNRTSVKPSWLSVFTDTGIDINIEGDAFNNVNTYSLFKKVFSPGTVSLGGNGGAGNNMYIVIAESASGGAPGDTTGPVLSNIVTDTVTSIGAVVSWNTDEAASSQIEYGLTTAYGSLSEKNTSLHTSHRRSISGLLPSTTYHYRLISIDSAGNQTTGVDRSFTTLSADPNGPALSGISAGEISSTSVVITWVSNTSASSQVEYGTTSAYGSSSKLNATLLFSHSEALSNLKAGTTYHYRVLSSDANGARSVSGDHTFKTTAAGTIPSDTTAPSDVAGFAAVGEDGRIVLSWLNPSESDFSGVRILFRTDRFPEDINDGTLLGDISGDPDQPMSLSHTDLTNGITYYYLAASYDASGNFQNTVFVSAVPNAPSPVGTDTNSGASGGSGGCGMIRPGSGNPPGPGDAAAILSLVGFILLALLGRLSGLPPASLFTKTGISRI